MNKKATLTGANVVLFAFTVLYFLFQFILILLSIIYGENFLKDNLYGILLVNQYVIIFIPVIIYMVFKKLDFKEVLRLNRLKPLPALLILLLSVPAQFAGNMLNSIAVYFLQMIGDIPANPVPTPGSYKELIFGLFVVAVSPAICEELLHRGLMLKAYENRGTIKAIMFTSVLFGIFHFDMTNFLGATFLGVLIAYYVIRTNSIFAGMLAHFLNNAIYEVFLFISGDNTVTGSFMKISVQELAASILYGVAGLIAIALLLYLFRKATVKTCFMKPSISSVRNDIISVVSHWPVIVIMALYTVTMLLFILSIALSNASSF